MDRLFSDRFGWRSSAGRLLELSFQLLIKTRSFYPPYLLPWFIVVPAFLYLRQRELELSVYRILSRQLNHDDPSHLTFLQHLSLYRADCIVLLLVIPIILSTFARCFPERKRAHIVAVCGSLLVAMTYIQVKSIDAIGRPQSWQMLLSAIQWYLIAPQQSESYLELAGLTKFITVIALTLSSAFLVGNKLVSLVARILSGVVPVIAAILVSALAVADVPSTDYYSSLFNRCLTKLIDMPPEGFFVRTPQRLTARQTQQSYFALAGYQEKPGRSPLFGSANGADIVFIILETWPSKVLPLRRALEQMPALRGLAPNSILGLNHWSTAPYSSSANFSILAGIYPLGSCSQTEAERVPGVMQNLKREKYQTGVFSSTPAGFGRDELMYRRLGADTIENAKTALLHETIDRRFELDQDVLDRAKSWMLEQIQEQRSYFMAFIPEASHAPWESLPGDLYERGRRIIAQQDLYVRQIVQLLKEQGRLEKTIIVITGDHGLRSRQEDPTLPGGLLDSRTFHTPLLIFSKAAFHNPIELADLSSHVDLTPTVLDLLGVEKGRDYEQGVSVLNSQSLKERTVFFVSDFYNGSDGYVSNGRWFMWNRAFDVVYQSEKGLLFEDEQPLASLSSESQIVRSKISAFYELRQAWFTNAVTPRSSPTVAFSLAKQ